MLREEHSAASVQLPGSRYITNILLEAPHTRIREPTADEEVGDIEIMEDASNGLLEDWYVAFVS